MIKIGIIGAGGYAGVNLLEILLRHPEARVGWLMSEEAHRGKRISELYPHLIGECDLVCRTLADLDKSVNEAELVFLALPHGISTNHVPDILNAGKKVIDLGSDYRFSEEAVYGLPEINRARIKKARLIGNPGCYPTASLLGAIPLVKENLVDISSIVVDAKSGFSGAGRGVSLKAHFCERHEGIEAYAVTSHRHMEEIEYQISRISGNQTSVTFVPHLMPMTRGILSTIYAKLSAKGGSASGGKAQNLKLKTKDIIQLYKKFYKGEPFVKVLEGVLPNTKFVAGTNYCHLTVEANENTGTVIVLSAIDNLIKGAAGQAVQNMNIMYGFEEKLGLKQIALYP